MPSSRANPNNTFVSPHAREWYAKARLSVSKFHELPRWSDLSLSEGDVEFVCAALHVASAEASNIDADMCVIWLVQQTRVNHIGNWVVPSLASLVNLSYRGMQAFLQYQSVVASPIRPINIPNNTFARRKQKCPGGAWERSGSQGVWSQVGYLRFTRR